MILRNHQRVAIARLVVDEYVVLSAHKIGSYSHHDVERVSDCDFKVPWSQ